MVLNWKLFFIALIFFIPTRAATEELKLEYHGAGWLQLGRVETSYSLPNNGNDYKHNWLGNTGGVLKTSAKIDKHWDGGFGIGTVMVHLARGALGQANKWYPFWVPFISEARLTYASDGYATNHGFQLNFGSMGYTYNNEAKNLGNYLLHGYVYPGTLVSASGNLFGIIGKAKLGPWQNDLILNMETEEKPFYDISVGDVLNYSGWEGLELTAGINYSRLIPMNKKLTSPGRDCDVNFLGPYADRGQENACYIIEKNAAGDSIGVILGSLGGIKAVARMKFDPKAFFSMGSRSFGKEDLIFYSEVGVIGLKNYAEIYDNILRRMPIMFGFNFPGFNFLNASVEMEYYASKLSSDNIAARSGSWVPVVDDPLINTKRDDWKWSVNISKQLIGNLILSAQMANDHLRLGGNHDQDVGVEAMRTPKDWYWTSKLVYFF